ncbi:hypothetical protein [Deinococcus hohokamensis]|uniref:Uncharacterized protein n=1 Tax=Deinococcus hohokamensis TaxID=309883 RepID=A0ABV9IDH5_9DEIO
MHRPLKSFELIMTFRVEIEENEKTPETDGAEVAQAKAGRALQDSLLQQLDLLSRLLPAMLADRIKGRASELFAPLLNSEGEDVTANDQALIEDVPAPQYGELPEFVDSGFFLCLTWPFQDSIVVSAVDHPLREV